jgi:hypothetical protein
VLANPVREPPITRFEIAALGFLAVVFLAWRVTLAYRVPAGMDEELFGVTGSTILRGGLPRIPYIPTRDLDSFYFGADICLYILPPLSFYLQALAQWVLGDGIGSARVASILEALASAGLVWALARRFLGNAQGAICSAAIFVFGRACGFPAMTARPDMAATLFGLATIWVATQTQGRNADSRGSNRRSAGLDHHVALRAGLLAGASLLAHPMGIAPFVHAGSTILLRPGSWSQRLLRGAVYVLAATLVFSLWGLLIALHPDLFWHQFRGAVIGTSTGGLRNTIANPWPVFRFQAAQFVDRAGLVQTCLYLAGLTWAMVRGARDRMHLTIAIHSLAAWGILVLFMGQHGILGYFAYPAAFLSIGAAGLAGDAAKWLAKLGLPPWCGTLFVSTTIGLCLIPGSGIRTLVAHIEHWHDPNYQARRFAEDLLDGLPPDARLAIDDEFVLDAWLAGRTVVNAHYLEFLPDFNPDLVILGYDGLRLSKIDHRALKLVETRGEPDNEFACWVRVYRPRAGQTLVRSAEKP